MIGLRIPGAFWSWFEGSEPMQRIPTREAWGDDYTGAITLHEAVRAARTVRSGRGYYLQVQFTGDPIATRAALECLLDYAETCIVINTQEPDHTELGGARKVAVRCAALLMGENR